MKHLISILILCGSFAVAEKTSVVITGGTNSFVSFGGAVGVDIPITERFHTRVMGEYNRGVGEWGHDNYAVSLDALGKFPLGNASFYLGGTTGYASSPYDNFSAPFIGAMSGIEIDIAQMKAFIENTGRVLFASGNGRLTLGVKLGIKIPIQ